ncbi:hypothetical protein [Lysinibacillus sp. JNUCC 51]|uniref:hypothetical protein n=1 Tax=Lysinibacillus sp. JNUCC-51 TaxID=2792479 RepID=UPI00193759E9|nr:hypothetical protein JNUCC51_15930 [Lysinibacillus sp. JNUCC-51]
MGIGSFAASVLAGIVATLILGTTGYKIINKNKQRNKINNSFNTNSNNNTTNNNHFNDSSQQNNAEQITINQSIKEKDD